MLGTIAPCTLNWRWNLLLNDEGICVLIALGGEFRRRRQNFQKDRSLLKFDRARDRIRLNHMIIVARI